MRSFWHCRDQFLHQRSADYWVYVPTVKATTERIAQFLVDVQDNMGLGKVRRMNIFLNSEKPCVVAEPTKFWTVPLHASMFSLLCRAGRFYDPKTKNVLEPLNHSPYLRGKYALLAAQKFVSGNFKTKYRTAYDGWRDCFSTVGNEQGVDKVLGIKAS